MALNATGRYLEIGMKIYPNSPGNYFAFAVYLNDSFVASGGSNNAPYGQYFSFICNGGNDGGTYWAGSPAENSEYGGHSWGGTVINSNADSGDSTYVDIRVDVTEINTLAGNYSTTTDIILDIQLISWLLIDGQKTAPVQVGYSTGSSWGSGIWYNDKILDYSLRNLPYDIDNVEWLATDDYYSSDDGIYADNCSKRWNWEEWYDDGYTYYTTYYKTYYYDFD